MTMNMMQIGVIKYMQTMSKTPFGVIGEQAKLQNLYLQLFSKIDCNSWGHMNFSHSWVPFGMKLNVSPNTITLNHEQIVLFGVVTNKDPPGCKKE